MTSTELTQEEAIAELARRLNDRVLQLSRGRRRLLVQIGDALARGELSLEARANLAEKIRDATRE